MQASSLCLAIHRLPSRWSGYLATSTWASKARGGDALVDHMRCNWSLGDGLALGAGPLATNVALHREQTGHIVEPLGHVFSDALH